MKNYAIGTPGQTIRMLLQVADPELAELNRLEGEVVVETEETGMGVISADGLTVGPLPADPALELLKIKAHRTGLLSACDWTQMPDNALTPAQRQAWSDYRQTLRDVPATQPNATVETVIWPTPPE